MIGAKINQTLLDDLIGEHLKPIGYVDAIVVVS
jgi:hypothetical protein